MNRQRLILFILVIIFVIAAIWSYSAVPRPKTVDKLTYASGQQAKTVPLAGRASVRYAYDGRILNISLLEREQADFKGYRRNIFKPIFGCAFKNYVVSNVRMCVQMIRTARRLCLKPNKWVLHLNN